MKDICLQKEYFKEFNQGFCQIFTGFKTDIIIFLLLLL